MRIPEHPVVLISVDGVSRRVLREMRSDGQLPGIQWLYENGAHPVHAVSGYPTITYAQFTSLITGLYPGRHGILGNKWFDRYTLTYRDYNTMSTYRDVDQDFIAPTVYERLPDRMTVSIQSPVRRGVTRTIDNWATGGIRWFFGRLQAFDSMMPTRFELIADIANETGRWPALIHSYHPSVDETGHRYGPNSPQYRSALRNADRQVQRILAAIESAGLVDRTYFVFVTDHGFEAVAPDHHFNVADWLRENCGLRVTDYAYQNEWYEQRHRHFHGFDAVVINGGNRRAVIHLRGPDGWHHRPTQKQLSAVLEPPSDAPSAGLAMHRGVKFLACALDQDAGVHTVRLQSPHGVSHVFRRGSGAGREYRYEATSGDALGQWADADLRSFIAEGWHNSRDWLAATVDSPFPDVVVQLGEMFASPRAGDLVLFAEDGWDFGSRMRGGHGSVTRSDMLIPMVFVGPGIPPGKAIPPARLVDVAPTILHLIRGAAAQTAEAPFDGVDLTPHLLQQE